MPQIPRQEGAGAFVVSESALGGQQGNRAPQPKNEKDCTCPFHHSTLPLPMSFRRVERSEMRRNLQSASLRSRNSRFLVAFAPRNDILYFFGELLGSDPYQHHAMWRHI